MKINGTMGLIDTKQEGENQKICPLLSISEKSFTPCQTFRCAFWIWHEVDNGEEFSDYGHCGFIHPGHQGMDMQRVEATNA